MKQFYGSVKNKAAVAGALAAGLTVSAGSAMAAVDGSVATAFAALQADAVSLAGIVTPIVVAIMGLGIAIKLIKKFGNKI